jgi:hypothetical protein
LGIRDCAPGIVHVQRIAHARRTVGGMRLFGNDGGRCADRSIPLS